MRSVIIAILIALAPACAWGEAETYTLDMKQVPGSKAFLAGIVRRMDMVKDSSPYTEEFIANRCFKYVLGRYPSRNLDLKRKRVGPKIDFNAEQQAGFAECLADDGYRLK